MTDRIHSFTVVLGDNLREDDAEKLFRVLECLQGVVSVQANVADVISYMAETRAKTELRTALLELLKPEVPNFLRS